MVQVSVLTHVVGIVECVGRSRWLEGGYFAKAADVVAGLKFVTVALQSQYQSDVLFTYRCFAEQSRGSVLMTNFINVECIEEGMFQLAGIKLSRLGNVA